MTEVNDTTPRPRGRPRKVENNPEPQVDERDLQIQILREELETMRQQNEYQMAMFQKLLARADIDEPTRPPKEDTLIVESNEDTSRVNSGRPRPGSLLGDQYDRNVGWVPWRKDDLNGEDMVDFVPAPVPSVVFPMSDEEGRQKIRLDVNDLVCWLTVGVPNHVNRFFYNAYIDAYNSWRELENFKRKGPAVAPWGSTGPDGRPSWYFEPMALSFGMDENGHAVTPFRSNPLRTYQQRSEGEAI